MSIIDTTKKKRGKRKMGEFVSIKFKNLSEAQLTYVQGHIVPELEEILDKHAYMLYMLGVYDVLAN